METGGEMVFWGQQGRNATLGERTWQEMEPGAGDGSGKRWSLREGIGRRCGILG